MLNNGHLPPGDPPGVATWPKVASQNFRYARRGEKAGEGVFWTNMFSID